MISLVLIKETKFELFLVIIVLMSFAGIVIVAYTDEEGEGIDTLSGNLLTLLSAFFYGLFTIILQKKVPSEKEDSFNYSLFLGMVGFYNLVLLIPLFFVLHYTGIETFEWPGELALTMLTVNAVIGSIFCNYCWTKSVVLLGPLTTTLGIALTIPLSMIVDVLDGKKVITWPYYIGTLFILGSFIGMSVKNYIDRKESDALKEVENKQPVQDVSDRLKFLDKHNVNKDSLNKSLFSTTDVSQTK